MAQSQPAAQQSRLAGCVNDEAGPHVGRDPVAQAAHANGSIALEQDIRHVQPLAHIDTVGPAVLEEQLVELGPPDLIRVWIALVGLAEVPAPGLAIPAPDHSGSGLRQEARLLHGG